ncbi:site-specific integrase [Burkholderia pseudomallei]|uniref:site-specific integrase n=1 Tax=Burkholderia pseudomallei TaxID=28450 RepID=UPI00050FF0A6|nr:site-specific integrase [Burkholderia pseudomallei]KGD02171.1 phage integrase family protein [Burkholderia pseudomallei]
MPPYSAVRSLNRGKRTRVRCARRVGNLQKGFVAACARAGIENFRIHDLRHTFASWLVMEGVSLYVVKDLLGHSSITVTERYAHLSPDHGREAVQKLLPL